MHARQPCKPGCTLAPKASPAGTAPPQEVTHSPPLLFLLHLGVNRTLELLQTEDLERLASLPLFEEKYQRLTNVTFLELMRKVYDFGLTQVCVCCFLGYRV